MFATSFANDKYRKVTIADTLGKISFTENLQMVGLIIGVMHGIISRKTQFSPQVWVTGK